jgi:hypothetical protein
MASDKKPDWPFYIAWILLTTLCIPAGFFAGLFLVRVLTSFTGDYVHVNGVRHIAEDYLGLFFIVPAIGLLIGAVQYGMLRRVLPRMGWWVLVTVGGWLLGMFLVSAFTRLQWMGPFNLNPIYLLFGLSIGFGQWLVLRRRVPAAGWWPVASLLGWGLVALVNRGNTIDQYGWLVLGFFPACATAAALALLVKRIAP